MDAAGPTTEQLTTLRQALRSYGRARFPALRAELDDLIAQTVSDVWECLAAQVDGRATAAPDDWLRLGYTVFRRRAADAYRKAAQRWAIGLDSVADIEQAHLVDQSDVRQRQSLLYGHMLRICLRELADVSERDRQLLAGVAGMADAPGGAMADGERQRLHRLRRRLGDAIRRELGEDARQLLREDV
jgi:hypothetical protein